ncbi:MAG: Rrf2 family transcriptional regulator [Lachnospiraceae bacterium]|nr:Rrf2 family transcriptional regulator [Lachnospiraceae bacterium]
MKISTKGRYAVRVMLDIAQQGTENYIPLMDIAKRQGISEKYLESIVAILSKNDFLQSLRGKGGGYRLLRSPEEYTVGSILKLVEGSFAPVACLEKKPNRCERAAKCQTVKMWEGLEKLLDDYFEGITIADLMAEGLSHDGMIDGEW